MTPENNWLRRVTEFLFMFRNRNKSAAPRHTSSGKATSSESTLLKETPSASNSQKSTSEFPRTNLVISVVVGVATVLGVYLAGKPDIDEQILNGKRDLAVARQILAGNNASEFALLERAWSENAEDFKRARELIAPVEETCSDLREECVVLKAQILIQEKKTRDAILMLEAHLRANPKRTHVMARKVVALNAAGRRTEAIAAIMEGLAWDESNVELQLQLLFFQNLTSDAESVRSTIDKILKQAQAESPLSGNDASSVIRSYEQVATDSSLRWQEHYEAARAYESEARHDKALAAVRAAVQTIEQSVPAGATRAEVQRETEDRSKAYALLGNMLRDRRDLVAAQGTYEKSLVLNPRLVSGHVGIGICSAAQRKYDDALNSFETALTIEPLNFPAIRNKALALLALKRYDVVQKYCESCVRNNVYAEPMYLIWHAALFESGDTAGSESVLRAAVDAFPRSVQLRRAYQYVLHKVGKQKEYEQQKRIADELEQELQSAK